MSRAQVSAGVKDGPLPLGQGERVRCMRDDPAYVVARQDREGVQEEGKTLRGGHCSAALAA
jgi:hypothetical protein